MHYEIFYNFGWLQSKSIKSNECNICHQTIEFKPLSHIIAYCKYLTTIRLIHFKKLHNILVEIINIPGNTHQLKYCVKILKILENTQVFTMELIKIIYGANFVDRYNKFVYLDSIKSCDYNSLKFLNAHIM